MFNFLQMIKKTNLALSDLKIAPLKCEVLLYCSD